MSVSIKLSPAAKIFRVLMGRNGFDNWVKSMEVVKETNFVNEQDLVTTLKKSGLSLTRRGNVYQTHFDYQYLLWEMRAGKWVAVFNEGDDVLELMRKIEQATKRQVFETEEIVQAVKVQCFPTNFNDMSLLKAVLADHSVSYQAEGEKLICQVDGKQLVFSQPAENGMIVVEVATNEPLLDIYNQISMLDEDYQSKVQEKTYLTFIQQAKERGFVVEQEEVLEDHSIMLTVDVMNEVR